MILHSENREEEAIAASEEAKCLSPALTDRYLTALPVWSRTGMNIYKVPKAALNLGILNVGFGDVVYQGVAESVAAYIGRGGRERLTLTPGNTLTNIIFLESRPCMGHGSYHFYWLGIPA